MKNDSIEDQCLNLLAKFFGVNTNTLHYEDNFINDLCADEMDLVFLVEEIEDLFNISIPEGEWEQVDTIKDVLEVVKSKCNTVQ